MRLSRCLAASLLLSSACAGMDDLSLGTEQAAIVGGTETTLGAFPAVVALTDGSHLCTATLVHPEWVLTAAHCVTPSLTGHATQAEVTDSFVVIFDDINVVDDNVSGRTLVRLQATFMHPDWDPANLGDNDVAVLHLAEPVTDRQPIPIHRTAVPGGTSVLQVGFGVSDAAANTGAGVLRQLSTINTGCTAYGLSDTNLLCFNADDGNGTCFGDSGGPTFIDGSGGKLEVAGITSFGANEQCTGLDASTQVAGELTFIDQYVPNGNTPPITDPPQNQNNEIGPPPTILGGCSIGGGHRDASAPMGALVLAAFALLASRRRPRARRSARRAP